MHNFVLFLLHFGVGVVWREDQVYLSAQRVDAYNPEVARVHLLLEALGVLHELLVQLAQDQLQVVREHVLARQVAQLDGKVHPGEVEEAQGVVILRRLRPRHNLVQKLAEDGYLAREVRVQISQEGVCEVKIGLEEQDCHRFEPEVDEHAIWDELAVVAFVCRRLVVAKVDNRSEHVNGLLGSRL